MHKQQTKYVSMAILFTRLTVITLFNCSA